MATSLRWRTYSTRTNIQDIPTVTYLLCQDCWVEAKQIKVASLNSPPAHTRGKFNKVFKERDFMEEFCSHRWGSSLPGLRTQDPPLGPPLTWAEIFRCTFLQSHLQTSPPNPQKSYPKLPNTRTTFENTPLSAQKCHSAGGSEGPRICGGLES